MHQSYFIRNQEKLKLHILKWPCTKANAKDCILLHGFSNNSFIWKFIAEQLKSHFNIYALDFRGHGDSQWDPSGNYKHQNFVEDLHACIESLDIIKPHIVGHSLGAQVGALYLEKYNKEINSFTIIDTAPETNKVGSTKIRQDIASMPTQFKNPNDYLAILKMIYVFSDKAALINMMQHDLRKNNEDSWSLKFDTRVAQSLLSSGFEKNKTAKKDEDLSSPVDNLSQKLWNAFEKIQAPCLVLRGQISAILRKEVLEEMVQRMPNAKAQQVSKAGHAVICDNPQECTTLLLNFFLETD